MIRKIEVVPDFLCGLEKLFKALIEGNRPVARDDEIRVIDYVLLGTPTRERATYRAVRFAMRRLKAVAKEEKWVVEVILTQNIDSKIVIENQESGAQVHGCGGGEEN